MRPNVPEIVRGLSASLVSGVLPELQSPWAQAQLRYTLTVLDTVRAEWDAAADDLFTENAALQAFCLRGATVADDAGAPAELAALRPSLGVAAALPPAPDIRLTTLDARNQQLWRAVEPVIALVVVHEGASWAGTLKAELAPLLRDYVARRRHRAR